MVTSFRVVSTARLALTVPGESDVPDLYELYADPQVWAADPLARHGSVEQTLGMVVRWRSGWAHDGLGMWVARTPGGELVGIGGCFVRYDVAWNLGYRLRPAFWGRGLAQEIVREAVAAAAELRPDLPMTAYLLEGNLRSQRATERAGLRPVWRGPDAGNPDPRAIRLLYADRDLTASEIAVLTDD
ncbi:GNAT family N-acetyltransferase [Cryptosporangium phraense]|uniref:GNAT family N-acetyltransferase n=1 Tax=Cryptosporangium phraense TaxID=2593070 RepID=A0A545AP99_9ACTN|nr:GNAT family N-acetyltransferase [Cryptosporangium phraense]TQS43152.1 GNAT family N-acetyltransferase [Cryptosporangium phraense]